MVLCKSAGVGGLPPHIEKRIKAGTLVPKAVEDVLGLKELCKFLASSSSGVSLLSIRNPPLRVRKPY